ncbi:MAG: DMT family transporter [Pseudomonadota bacterium]
MAQTKTAVAASALLLMGVCWGLTMPLTKIAVSTGHGHFGLIFWQLVLVSGYLGAAMALGGRRPRVGRRHLVALLVIAGFGTIIPNSFSYIAAGHLPSGVMSIVISLVPMSTLLLALAWRSETFEPLRLLGLVCGLVAVVLLVAPEASLPNPAAWPFVFVSALATLCYGFEANWVARFGLGGMGAVEALLFSSILGAVITLPLALGSGQFIAPTGPWAEPEWALVALAALHAVAYTGYIWLVGYAGPVFAAQVSYVVTLVGVGAAMVVLGERYSGWIWAALGLMLVGLALVTPRPRLPERGDAGAASTGPLPSPPRGIAADDAHSPENRSHAD